MLFNVLYSQLKDIDNYINSIWHFSYLKHGREGMEEKLLKFFPDDFKKDIKGAKDEQEARIVVGNYLDSMSQVFKNQTEVIVVGVEKILNDKQLEIVNLLESIYQNKFPFKKITVFLTTLGICPYSYEKRWFMTRRSNNVDGHIAVAKHELNHFMFYYYYLNKLEKMSVSREKIEKLKEALAILTNPEGNNKPEVKGLEVFIQSQKNKTIDQIIGSVLERNIL